MAKYDQGGGCPCGVNKICDCATTNYEYYKDENGMAHVVPTKPTLDKKVVDTVKDIAKIAEDTPFKFSEGKILADLDEYVRGTYGEHYKTDTIECFDAWIALGDSTATFRNTALKYLWRYGKKGGNNKKDLMKAIHYIMLCIHVDHYLEKND